MDTIYANPALHSHRNGQIALEVLHNVINAPGRKHESRPEAPLLQNQATEAAPQKPEDSDTRS